VFFFLEDSDWINERALALKSCNISLGKLENYVTKNHSQTMVTVRLRDIDLWKQVLRLVDARYNGWDASNRCVLICLHNLYQTSLQ
jgi:hypothetical protein